MNAEWRRRLLALADEWWEAANDDTERLLIGEALVDLAEELREELGDVEGSS